jgi:hypothetical protein
MATISDGTTTITPAAIVGWSTTRQSRNVVHDIIGRPDPDVTLRPAATRAGTLSLLFMTYAAALAAEQAHAAPAVWTLTGGPDDEPGLVGTYVVDGAGITTREDGPLWSVDVGYREVTP